MSLSNSFYESATSAWLHLETFLDELGLKFLKLGKYSYWFCFICLFFVNTYTYFDVKYNSQDISMSRFHCYVTTQHCLGNFVMSAIWLLKLSLMSKRLLSPSEGASLLIFHDFSELSHGYSAQEGLLWSTDASLYLKLQDFGLHYIVDDWKHLNRSEKLQRKLIINKRVPLLFMF